MAEQWEYFMIELERRVTKGANYWFLRPLTAEGQVLSGNSTKAAPAELNAIGAQGWELVTSGRGFDGDTVLIFKRRKE